MTVTLTTAKAHLNVTISDDDSLITAQIAGAVAYVENQLGFAIDDATQFPDGTPADLDQAVLMMVAHWYADRETVIVSESRAVAIVVPLGAAEIINEYRNFTFGLPDDD